MLRFLRRLLVWMGRLPVLADRRGMRWLLNGRVMPGGPLAIITYRGRRTGKTYTRPVESLVEETDPLEIVVTPMRGERSDWYRNVLEGGLIGVRFRGEAFEAKWRELSEDERIEVLHRYLKEHPVFGRMVLSGMARGQPKSGDRVADAARAGKLLALTLG